MPYRYIKLEQHGDCVLLTMDNPGTLNAMDEDMGPELVGALESLARDEAARAVVLTGAGGVFSAGGNVVKAYRHQESRANARSSEVFEAYTKLVTRVVVTLTGMPQPVVAAVRGAASGAGLAWMLAADLVVAAENARLLPGFLGIGLVPAAGINQGLSHHLGRLAAAEMLMLNQELSPADALRLGFVNRVVPAEETVTTALALAQKLAAAPRRALAHTKALLKSVGRAGLFTSLENERRAVMEAADQPDFAQRAIAFLGRQS